MQFSASRSAIRLWPPGPSDSNTCCHPDLAASERCSTARPDADVVVIAHHGFDGLRLISDIWRGGLVRLVVRVRVTRVARSTVPEEAAARVDWLYDLWQGVDDWLEEQFAAAGKQPAA